MPATAPIKPVLTATGYQNTSRVNLRFSAFSLPVSAMSLLISECIFSNSAVFIASNYTLLFDWVVVLNDKTDAIGLIRPAPVVSRWIEL